jgi:hypothetical protein
VISGRVPGVPELKSILGYVSVNSIRYYSPISSSCRSPASESTPWVPISEPWALSIESVIASEVAADIASDYGLTPEQAHEDAGLLPVCPNRSSVRRK